MTENAPTADPVECLVGPDDVWTFGEIEGPCCDEINVPLGDWFQCPCGTNMPLSDPWLAAHWTEKLTCRCTNPKCGQQFHLRAGRVRLKGRPYGSSQHVFGT